MTLFINDLVNEKISAALEHNTEEQKESAVSNVKDIEPPEPVSKIITTEEELESFYVIRGMFVGMMPIEDITYKDTESYFGVLYKSNTRKPICRLNLDAKNKYILLPDDNKKFEKIYIKSVNDLYKLKEALWNIISRYTV